MEALFLGLWVGCALMCWAVANSKGRWPGVWLVLGLLFGIFALIAVAAMPSKLADKNAPRPDTHVKCPDCRELVLKDAKICRYCRCKLIPQT